MWYIKMHIIWMQNVYYTLINTRVYNKTIKCKISKYRYSSANNLYYYISIMW